MADFFSTQVRFNSGNPQLFKVRYINVTLKDMSRNPHGSRLDKETMTNSARWKRMAADPNMPKRGRECVPSSLL
ncbi:hypothetical protein MTR_3g450290 [Medicago truncatula]|uniref:Uncharacterized protein n=1 Tax=Medicago truncatula TaxID=3880 RepID=A0A072UX56_MEDTR|nr:hypothetical protein MTR_3g450290 [Medicago truncatula]